jgi:hypothetical protein
MRCIQTIQLHFAQRVYIQLNYDVPFSIDEIKIQ